MTATPNLTLPYLASNQAQKHVTLNESLSRLDILAQLTLTDFALSDPPVSPFEGMAVIVGTSPTGAFAGMAGMVAAYLDGAWIFISPQPGWTATLQGGNEIRVFDGTDWNSVLAGQTQFGINTSASATDRLAVSSSYSLFTHEGADHRLKVNKNAAGDVASVLFQQGYQGYAEFGLQASNRFELKSSSDGSSWVTALGVAPGEAAVEMPAVRSGQISIDNDSVGSITPPASGGILAIMITHPDYPQVTHSGIFAYDVGPSLALMSLCIGTKMNNLSQTVLTGTTGPDEESSIAVAAGEIVIENRIAVNTYTYTFLA